MLKRLFSIEGPRRLVGPIQVARVGSESFARICGRVSVVGTAIRRRPIGKTGPMEDQDHWIIRANISRYRILLESTGRLDDAQRTTVTRLLSEADAESYRRILVTA